MTLRTSTPSVERSRRRTANLIAVVGLVTTLGIMAAARLWAIGVPPHGHAIPGLMAQIDTPVALGIAGAVELGLAVAFIRGRHSAAATGVLLWCSILAGLLGAMLIVGLPVSACACFGPRPVPLSAKLLVVSGLATLAWLVLEGARAARGDHDAAPSERRGA